MVSECKLCGSEISTKFVSFLSKQENHLGDHGEMEILDAGLFCDGICLLDYLTHKKYTQPLRVRK